MTVFEMCLLDALLVLVAALFAVFMHDMLDSEK